MKEDEAYEEMQQMGMYFYKRGSFTKVALLGKIITGSNWYYFKMGIGNA